MATRDVLPWALRNSQVRRASGVPGDFNSLFNTLHDQIERAFNNVWGGLETSSFGDGRRAFAATDISESEGAFEICVELPGFAEKDIDISLSDDGLVIKAEMAKDETAEPKGYVYSERRHGSVYRTLPLPPSTDLDKVSAHFENGILTITAPKSEKAKSAARKIPLGSQPKR